jgi:serine protease
VINVGAINNFDDQTPFTNFGNSLDLVAPTGTVTTDISGPEGNDPGDYSSVFGGTSSACPVAAGIAALVVTVAPEKTGTEIGQLLIDSARPAPFAVPDANGHDPVFGYGIIDPPEALKVALGISTGEGGGNTGGGAPTGGGSADGDEAGDDGCGCAMAPTESPSGLLLLALAALGYYRKKRG